MEKQKNAKLLTAKQMTHFLKKPSELNPRHSYITLQFAYVENMTVTSSGCLRMGKKRPRSPHATQEVFHFNILRTTSKFPQ